MSITEHLGMWKVEALEPVDERLTVHLSHEDGSPVIPVAADIGEDNEWAERFTTQQIEETYRLKGDHYTPSPSTFHDSFTEFLGEWEVFAYIDEDDHLTMYLQHEYASEIKPLHNPNHIDSCWSKRFAALLRGSF